MEIHQCVRCREPYMDCVCPDEPEKSDPFYHRFNRMMEEWARWLRYWGVLK